MSIASLRSARGFWPACLFGIGLVCAPVAALAQKEPQETVNSLTTADGFEIRLFAAEPMIANPIAIDVDTYGRVWVTEGTKYRQNVGNPPDDKIKVLEDTDGDGVADKVTVFTSDLNAALGICVAGSKIYVPESPNLYVYEDKDNDLKPDGPRQIFLKGFGGQNHDHGVHSQVFGPDHKLYMTNGDTSYDVTGPDGKRIKYQWGAMIRCEGDGSQLEDFAINFRNPVELAVDSFGNVWCSDNDNDGLKSVRICWILEGGNYGWFGKPENIRNPDGSFDPIHHWRADIPGFVPYVMITGFGSPCGMTFYESGAFGEQYRNRIIHCDAGPREIRAYSPERLKGVGYTASLENIVTSSDNYFRPVDPCVAPDGSIYVTDWYDGGVGGHAYNDPTRGRIYRITPRGQKLARKEKPGPYTDDKEALAALASPNHATTFLARERLLASGEKSLPGLEKLSISSDRALKARALWLLDRIGGQGRNIVRRQLTSSDPTFRALAVRILRRHGEETISELLPLAVDADGEVFKEVLLAAGASKSPQATAAIIKAFERYDGSDRYLLETLGIAARGREAEVFAQVVDRPEVTISPRLINIVRILRPDDATKYLTARLSSANLSPEITQTLLTAISSVAAPEAGKAVLALLASDAKPDVKRLALGALKQNLAGPWNSLARDPALLQAVGNLLENRDLAAEALAVIGEAGLRDAAPAVLVLMVSEASSPAVKLAAIDVVARLGLSAGAPNLVGLLRSENRGVADAALRALVLLREAKSLGAILADARQPAELRQQTADLLMGSSDGAVLLFRLVDTGKLEKSLADRVIATAIDHPDVNVRLLFEKYIPADQRPKTLGQSFKPDEILALTGDPARGEGVFLRSGAASCNKCHRVKGKGADIGPDLSQIGRKYERKALLETIMNPSAGIAPEYVPYVVETEQGRVYAGFLVDQNDDRVVLKSIEGATIQLPRKDVAELARQDKSLMPELVLKSVTAQDGADLLAYLVSLQDSTVHATKFKALGPFPNGKPDDRTRDFGPEKSPERFDGAATYEAIGGKKAGWVVASSVASPDGTPMIDLRQVAAEQKGPADNVLFYFAATLDSSAAQEATLSIGSDDGIQIWLNGQKVHDHKVTRALTPGEDKVKVQLKSGKNLLLLKLDQGNGNSGLTLSAEARGNLTFGVP